MPGNVTSATCEYGLALDAHGGCVATLASFDHTNYTITRYAYGAAGFLALCTASYKLRLALQYDGAMFNQYGCHGEIRTDLLRMAYGRHTAAAVQLRAVHVRSHDVRAARD